VKEELAAQRVFMKEEIGNAIKVAMQQSEEERRLA